MKITTKLNIVLYEPEIPQNTGRHRPLLLVQTVMCFLSENSGFLLTAGT